MSAAPHEPPVPDDSSASEAQLYGMPIREPAHDDSVRDAVELAATDFLEQLRAGVKPSIEDYVRRYPRHAEQLRATLPLVAAMEMLKHNRALDHARTSMPATSEFEQLGNCRIVREIGRGGMGIVFEAIEQPSNRRVAVKLLPWRFTTPQQRARFLGEARTTARLRHPHIVPVYGFGEQDGWCYYIMHLVEGLPLDVIIRHLLGPAGAVFAEDIRKYFAPDTPANAIPTFIKTNDDAQAETSQPAAAASENDAPTDDPKYSRVLRKEAWLQFARIGMQAAMALSYAHARGTLHRDIKPANLLVDRHGSVWIADFGIAMQKDAAGQQGDVHGEGTLPYIAPEQLEGRVDERSDLYSLGVTLYELCTLRRAYNASDRRKLLEQVQAAAPPRPRSINRNIPVELERIIVKTMARDPSQRYQTAEELFAALRKFAQNKQSGSNSKGWGESFGWLFPSTGS